VYHDGEIIGHSGAWRAGVDGARAGLMMPAQTPVGLQHYQEVAPGIAMDRAEIVADNVTFETPMEAFNGCLKVLETSPLEPGDDSIKLYAPDVGMIFDDELIIVDRGRNRIPPSAPVDVTVNLGGAFSEVEITEAEMPVTVAALLLELHPTGIIHEVKRETRKTGRIVYAIEIFIDGHQWDVEATADGTILRNEAEARKGAPWVDLFPMTTCTHATTGSNRYFILEPGYQIILASNSEQVAMTVLNETETVNGIETRVIEEREFANGKLNEVSRNFFTICREHGDVFYHGEDVDVYQDGKIIGHSGAWRAGVDGARAGLMMPAQTPVGLRHYQEVAPGIAMDRAEIVENDVTFEGPAGAFWECLKVLETSPLEPGDECVKLYAPDVGMIFDDDVVIIDRGRNRASPSAPVDVTVDLGGAYSEVEITDAEMPAPVAAVLRQLHPTGIIHEVKREMRKGGQIVYAIEIFIEGHQWDVEATADGTVLRNEAE